MECSGRSSNQNKKCTTRPCKSGIVFKERNTAATTITTDASTVGAIDLHPQRPSGKHDLDQMIPIFNIIRMMRRALPPNAMIEDGAEQAILACVVRFIRFITSEANKNCKQQCRRTITAPDILRTTDSLGLHNYAELLEQYLSKYRAQANPGGCSSSNHVPLVGHNANFIQQRTAQPPPHMAAPPFLLPLLPSDSLVQSDAPPPLPLPLLPNQLASDSLPRSFLELLQNPRKNEFEED